MAGPKPDAGAGSQAGSRARANPVDTIINAAKSLPKPAPPRSTPASRSRPASAASASTAGIPPDVLAAITRAAKETGVPLQLALAMAQQESGFNTHAVGDNGSSFGLYQLHQGGELGSLSPQQAMDPYTNAKVSLTQVAATMKAHPGADMGTIAALAQRPADAAGYAQSVNSILHGGTFTAGGAVAGSGSGVGGFGTAGTAGVTDTSAPLTLPKNATPQQIQQFVEQNYPDIVPYLHDKEIGPILLQAAQGGWSDARLQGAVQKTNFWKTHSQSQRAWDLLNGTDHATAKAQVQSTMAQVMQLVQQSGQSLSPLQVHDVAVRALRNGYSADQLKADIAAQSKIKVGPDGTTQAKGALPGAAQVSLDSLKQQAATYLVPVSDATLQTWVNQIANGKVPPAAFDSYLKEQAKSLFPGMSTAIDSGVTPQQYTDPYRNIAAQTLEVAPDSVNFSDPKWAKALFQIDPKTGARTSMSLADWGKTLRSDPIYGYGKTAGAKSQAADFAENILNTFGAVGNYGGNG